MIRTGYLVLADLSGFTSFVATSELDHGQAILAQILTTLRGRLTPMLDLAEVEGDALFLYAADGRLTRGETLIELIEDAYVAFRDRQATMRRNATCPCRACQAIGGLDLKFVTHWGEWVLQDLTGQTKPFGSSVNLAHRLLKNDVATATGWSAYALFTDAALGRLGIRPDGMHTSVQHYPHLGDWHVGALDLRQRYAELTAKRVAYLAEENAHFTVRRRYGAPVAKVWESLNDIDLRNRWEIGADWSVRMRTGGRQAVGSRNHCAASDFLEEVLDWRPFDYYTVRTRGHGLSLLITGELRPDGPETEVRWSIALEGRAPAALRAIACRLFATRLMRVPQRFDRLGRLLLAGDAGRPADDTPQPV